MPEPLAQVLIACKDIPYANTLADFLQSSGHTAERCHDAKGVLRFITRKSFDVIILDLDVGEDSAIDLIAFAHRRRPNTQIVLLFDIAKIERALDGIRAGAYFYLPRTCQPSDVALVVGKALRTTKTDTALSEYEQNLLEETIGTTPAMKRVLELITKVAPTDSTVLLLGESGTGKEVLAHAVHRLSPRGEKPFIAINCAALPDALLESEMFGHMKGSFTGADADKRGLFEEAEGGTIFLDEIGDMAPVTQAKLLRVLQNGEIRPVGAAITKRVDVRVVAATNRDLAEAVRANKFREDLYFRLNVIQIRIPPLRERPDALAPLVKHFLGRFNTRFRKNVTHIDEQTQSLLRNYPYPGNVRELESIIAHAVIMADTDTVTARDLPDDVRQGIAPRLALPNFVAHNIPTLDDMEAQAIRAALEKVNGNQTKAAKKLGISRSTLWRKIKEYDITCETK